MEKLHLLPKSIAEIYQSYEALDTIYCFIAVSGMKSTLSQIDLLGKSLGLSCSYNDCLPNGQRTPSTAVLWVSHACKDIFEVKQNSFDKNDFDLIVSKFPGKSESFKSKRKKAVFQSLFTLVVQSAISSHRQLSKLLKEHVVLNSGWPEGIDLAKVEVESMNSMRRHTDNLRRLLIDQNDQSCSEKSMPAEANIDISAPEGKETLVNYLKEQPFYKSQLEFSKTIPGKSAQYRSTSNHLHSVLVQAIENSLGVTSFYSHQSFGIDAILEGKHLNVSTTTASGKSIIYNTAILNTMIDMPSATALYIFPTKALAQDQYRVISSLCRSLTELQPSTCIIPAVCDGDVAFSERNFVRENANIILTNPDLVHFTLLPEHKTWRRVFSNLKYIVIDESHTYRGSFGSQVAAVFKRLVRICAHYNAFPQFISLSATIANSVEHMQRLLPISCLGGEESLATIDQSMDGSPTGERLFVIWNPPLKTEKKSSEMQPVVEKEEEVGGQDLEAVPEELVSTNHTTIVSESSKSNVESTSDNVNNVNKTAKTPDNADFIEDCCDRPNVFGGKNDLVSFPGSWKRKPMRKWRDESTTSDDNDGASSKISEDDLITARDGDFLLEPSRFSTIVETAKIFSAVTRAHVKTLAFCKVRKLVELVLKYSKEELKESMPHLAELISSYRGGYTKEDRRAIEQQMFQGKLIGVIATCALELGIDIGQLDCTIHMGFPGAFSSLWQQAGRAGRGGRQSMSIFVCFDGPIDQYYARNPEELFNTFAEHVIVDADNPNVLRKQLICAAKELPLNSSFQFRDDGSFDDEKLWGNNYRDMLLELINEGLLYKPDAKADMYVPRISIVGSNPAREFSIRAIDPVVFEVIDDSGSTSAVIDSIEYSRAFYELFEGAIYFNKARQYLVHKLDITQHKAYARPVAVNYYTSAMNLTTICLLRIIDNDDLSSIGRVKIQSQVNGFKKIRFGTGEVFDKGEFSLPPLEFETQGLFLDIPIELKRALITNNIDVISATHAANHVLLIAGTLLSQCDTHDLDCEHSLIADGSCGSRLLLYDKQPGGLGICSVLYIKRHALVDLAKRLIDGCTCDIGCTCCILGQRCTSFNKMLNKRGASMIFQYHIDSRSSTKVRGTCEEVASPSPKKKLRAQKAYLYGLESSIRIQDSWTEQVKLFQADGS